MHELRKLWRAIRGRPDDLRRGLAKDNTADYVLEEAIKAFGEVYECGADIPKFFGNENVDLAGDGVG